ncbi:gp53-like domain-containing protein, partial [Pseudomonas huaxiensis]|uniref:gp53-like domain-containing protein n=1 Tax=Pseudomonas huaxiensis TaxID=2213017 RepID=UPI00384D6DB9
GAEINAKADKVTATTSVAGIARIATQTAVDAAAETNTFVTPVTLGARLRAGFIWSSNYVVFPSWLGSLIFQWGTVATPGADVAYDVTFPLAFPNAVRTLQVSWGYVGARTDNSIVPQIGDQTLVGFKANRQDAYTASSVPNSYINYFAIGH